MARKLVITITIISFFTLCYTANVSFNQIGDIIISYDGKTFVCDKLTCPELTQRCIVTKKSLENDKTQLERWSRCVDEKNQILLEDKKQESNPLGNGNVDVYVEHGMNGIYSLYNDTDAQRIVEETLREVEKNLHRVQEDLQKQFKHLENIFD